MKKTNIKEHSKKTENKRTKWPKIAHLNYRKLTMPLVTPGTGPLLAPGALFKQIW